MPEGESPELPIQETRESTEAESGVLQREVLDCVEQQLADQLQREHPAIPEEERKLETLVDTEGREVGSIERFQQSSPVSNNPERVWLVLDFNDVIHQTSRQQGEIREGFSRELGLLPERYDELYESSKVPNEHGKPMLQEARFRELLLEQFPDRAGDVDRLLASSEPEYVDPAVRRMLLLLRTKDRDAVRISVLTYGELERQHRMLDASGIEDLIDEAIYTEGEKPEAIAALVSRDYPSLITSLERDTKSGDAVERFHKQRDQRELPIILTVDDSPEQVEAYEQLPYHRRFVNVRYRHPMAKRSGKPHVGERVVTYGDHPGHHGAVDVYRAVEVATYDRERWKKLSSLKPSKDEFVNSRESLAEYLRDPDQLDSFFAAVQPYRPQQDIRYRREGDAIIREAMRVPRTPSVAGIDIEGDPSGGLWRDPVWVKEHHGQRIESKLTFPPEGGVYAEEFPGGYRPSWGGYQRPFIKGDFDAEEFINSAERGE